MPSLKASLKTVKKLGNKGALFLMVYRDGRATFYPGKYIADGAWMVGLNLAKWMRPSQIEAIFIQPPGVQPANLNGVPFFVANESSSILMDETVFGTLWSLMGEGDSVHPDEKMESIKDIMTKLLAYDGTQGIDTSKLEWKKGRRFFLRFGSKPEIVSKEVPIFTSIGPKGISQIADRLGVSSATWMANQVIGQIQPELMTLFSKLSIREIMEWIKVAVIILAFSIGVYIIGMGLRQLGTIWH